MRRRGLDHKQTRQAFKMNCTVVINIFKFVLDNLASSVLEGYRADFCRCLAQYGQRDRTLRHPIVSAVIPPSGPPATEP